eukprot:2185204-Rhodomonas_salina.1
MSRTGGGEGRRMRGRPRPMGSQGGFFATRQPASVSGSSVPSTSVGSSATDKPVLASVDSPASDAASDAASS